MTIDQRTLSKPLDSWVTIGWNPSLSTLDRVKCYVQSCLLHCEHNYFKAYPFKTLSEGPVKNSNLSGISYYTGIKKKNTLYFITHICYIQCIMCILYTLYILLCSVNNYIYTTYYFILPISQNHQFLFVSHFFYVLE
jgi:hypothetical protein